MYKANVLSEKKHTGIALVSAKKLALIMESMQIPVLYKTTLYWIKLFYLYYKVHCTIGFGADKIKSTLTSILQILYNQFWIDFLSWTHTDLI